jgi:hypothetical protein
MLEALEAWKDFNVAMVGATAALAGLAIVAASVNIRDIIKAKALTARLAAGVATLVLALVVATVGLIPGLSLATYGVTVIAVSAVAGIFQVDSTRRIFQNRHPENQWRPVKAAVGFVPLISYLVGGVLLSTGGSAGLPLLAIGSILAIISALIVSWVVLVEILR